MLYLFLAPPKTMTAFLTNIKNFISVIINCSFYN